MKRRHKEIVQKLKAQVDALQREMAVTERYRLELNAESERFQIERDRRYTEVNIEREKALKIKEQADRDALALDRTIRDYKDEKANELREQIGRERLLYATKEDLVASFQKIEAIVTPLATYIASQQGRSGGLNNAWGWLLGLVGLLAALFAIWRR